MFNLVLKFVVILKEIATERHLTSTEEKMLDNGRTTERELSFLSKIFECQNWYDLFRRLMEKLKTHLDYESTLS